jgi:2-dehydropantoate 2-reductase
LQIGIIGAGALGSLFAVRLYKSGQNIVIFHKDLKHIQKIIQDGINLVGVSGKRDRANVQASSTVANWDLDLVLVTVKAYDTGTVGQYLRNGLDNSVPVLTVQNGLGNIEILSRSLGRHRILGGSTTEASLLIRPGYAKHTGSGLTQLGELNGQRSKRIMKLVRVFEEAGFRTKISNQIMTVIWSKAILNSAVNPLTGLTHYRNGEILERPEICDLSREIIEEAIRVAKCMSIPVKETSIQKSLKQVLSSTHLNKSSMLQDLENNRKTEIDQLNGAIMKLGEKYKVPTPYNSFITAAVRYISQSK